MGRSPHEPIRGVTLRLSSRRGTRHTVLGDQSYFRYSQSEMLQAGEMLYETLLVLNGMGVVRMRTTARTAARGGKPVDAVSTWASDRQTALQAHRKTQRESKCRITPKCISNASVQARLRVTKVFTNSTAEIIHRCKIMLAVSAVFSGLPDHLIERIAFDGWHNFQRPDINS